MALGTRVSLFVEHAPCVVARHCQSVTRVRRVPDIYIGEHSYHVLLACRGGEHCRDCVLVYREHRQMAREVLVQVEEACRFGFRTLYGHLHVAVDVLRCRDEVGDAINRQSARTPGSHEGHRVSDVDAHAEANVHRIQCSEHLFATIVKKKFFF